MEFLRPVLGEALYAQVRAKLAGRTDVKLVNLAEGRYVDKRKFKAKAERLKKAEAQNAALQNALYQAQTRASRRQQSEERRQARQRQTQRELLRAADRLLALALQSQQAETDQ